MYDNKQVIDTQSQIIAPPGLVARAAAAARDRTQLVYSHKGLKDPNVDIYE